MKLRSTVLTLLFGSLPAIADVPADLPNPHLLPTTRLIHEAIMARQAEAAEDGMEAYSVRVPLAEGVTIEMVPIPGGEFLMGSPEDEPGRAEDEGPQRRVQLEPFWMARVEINWAVYRPFMENGMARNKDGTLNRDSDLYTSDPPEILEGETLVDTVTQPTPPYVPMHFGMGNGYSAEYPAVGMTHHAANKFCEWLSAQTGEFFRLPTEAEWEYAARAGTTTAYHFGDDPEQLKDYAWFAENSEFQYQQVGTRKPNPWGLHDMHGNVAELVIDQYEADRYAKLEDGASAPWLPAAERYPTVFRGGHWDADPEMLRSAARGATDAGLKDRDPQIPKSIWYHTDAPWLGFRIVRPQAVPTVEEMHRYWNMGPGPTE